MKKLFILCTGLLAATGVRAALPQPDLIAQIHFAGAQKISAAQNFSAFMNEFCSAAARDLARQTLDKLSRAPGVWFKPKMAANANDGVAQLRPLLDDLLQSEWFFEARDLAKDAPGFALAIRLRPERAQVWSKNLTAILQSWTGLPVVTDETGAWELKKHDSPNLIRFLRAGDWVVIDAGNNNLSLREKILAAIKTPPPANWLTMDVNWPRIAQWIPMLKELGLPETQFTVTAPDDNLRINGKFLFPENLVLNLEPWRVPTDTIHQPFSSFTAVRGFAAWWQSRPWTQPYQILPAPNQMFVWALPQIPYQTYAALPVADARAALAQADVRLRPIFNSPSPSGNFRMPFTLLRTNDEITLTGAPFIAPYLQAVRQPGGQFLLAGAFPNAARAQALPVDLRQRLAEKNLVLYHWEITAERLPDVLNLSQLSLLLTSHRQLEGESASMKWILKIAPTLGNNATEITQTGPAEMTFARKGNGIFTAVELLALGNWLEGPDFPAFDLKLPTRANIKRLHPRPTPPSSAPAPIPAK